MSVGKLKEFDVKNGQWASFVDRMEMYFLVNEVAEDLRVPTMIAAMGDEAYELLVNLASPEKPSALTYSQAVELMRQHLQPTPSALAERYRFRQRRQGAIEDTASYVAELKRLSRNCKFGGNLSDNLRDQFVCGLRSDVIKQRLFAEDDDITFAGAVKLACSLEAAERDAAAVDESATAAAASAVHALKPAAERKQYARAGGRAGSAERGARTNCAACGARSHESSSCRFRKFVCSRCQRVGHLRRVCPEVRTPGTTASGSGYDRERGQKKGGFNFGDVEGGNNSEEDDIEENLNLLSLNRYKPVQMDKEICDLIDRYSEVFSGELGRYLGGKATLRVREDATPVFRRARPMPYAMRERVDAELDAMLRDKIIESV